MGNLLRRVAFRAGKPIVSPFTQFDLILVFHLAHLPYPEAALIRPKTNFKSSNIKRFRVC